MTGMDTDCAPPAVRCLGQSAQPDARPCLVRACAGATGGRAGRAVGSRGRRPVQPRAVAVPGGRVQVDRIPYCQPPHPRHPRLLHRQLQVAAQIDGTGGRGRSQDPRSWQKAIGTHTWFFIHSVAAKYPEHPSAEDQRHMINFIAFLGQVPGAPPRASPRARAQPRREPARYKPARAGSTTPARSAGSTCSRSCGTRRWPAARASTTASRRR